LCDRAGYVGLVTAAGFADLGNCAVSLDVDEQRVEISIKALCRFMSLAWKSLWSGFAYQARFE